MNITIDQAWTIYASLVGLGVDEFLLALNAALDNGTLAMTGVQYVNGLPHRTPIPRENASLFLICTPTSSCGAGSSTGHGLSGGNSDFVKKKYVNGCRSLSAPPGVVMLSADSRAVGCARAGLSDKEKPGTFDRHLREYTLTHPGAESAVWEQAKKDFHANIPIRKFKAVRKDTKTAMSRGRPPTNTSHKRPTINLTCEI
jgi:hypothetical protein